MRRLSRYALLLFTLLGLCALIYSPPSHSWPRDWSRLKPVKTYGPFTFEQNESDETSTGNHASSLHLLIPATRSNEHLCRLLLSTSALGYPTPVLLNWDTKEDEDIYKEHLKKVYGALNYLSKLPRKHDKDLALMVDGYDIWFQLRPEVLIKRYYGVINATNTRLFKRVGIDAARQVGVYNSVVFGADKICWPKTVKDVACWAVPESTMPKHAFGPHTDRGSAEFNRPRWLNSGTIMGPVAHVRSILNATVNLIETTNTTVVSDQFHFLSLWGDQEYARRALALAPQRQKFRRIWIPHGRLGKGSFKRIEVDSPPTPSLNNEKEYHITLDYESQMFQLLTYYGQYVTWIRYDESWRRGLVSPQYPMDESYHLQLEQDIASSLAPFTVRESNSHLPENTNPDDHKEHLSLPESISWSNLSLGTNAISRHVFPIIHFTPPKTRRQQWWPRMWFYPYAKAVINSSAEIAKGPYCATADGRTWTNHVAAGAAEPRGAGAVDEKGRWLPWAYICASHKAAVFSNEREYVPKPRKGTPTLNDVPHATESVDPTRSLIF